MIDVPNSNVQVKCLVGAPQTGRTDALVQEAARRAAEGAHVLFVCARERDVHPVRKRMAASLADLSFGGDADRVRVAVGIDVAQVVLAAPEARAMFGRGPRVLEPYEEAVLLEDLKVSQMKNRRLRKVLTYLRAGWSNLSDDTWEQTAEEDLVIDRMRANLRFTGGVLACEASNLALHALREHDALRQRVSWDYVFVDDFELLSRASQHLVRMIAARGLAVASAERPGLPGDEEYPCFEGAAELLAVFPGAQVVRLIESVQAPEVRHRVRGLFADPALKLLIRHDAMEQATPSAKPLDADEVHKDECRDVSKRLSSASFAVAIRNCDGGGAQDDVFTCIQQHSHSKSEEVQGQSYDAGSSCRVSADSDVNAEATDAANGVAHGRETGRFAQPALRMLPSLEAELQTLAIEASAALERGESVLIVGTNRLWRRNVAANLQRVGLPVRQLRGDKLRLKDFRDEKQCTRARADALRRLRVNAADGVAWRTLLALGDGVARSAGVDYLRQAVGTGTAGAPVRLREALELLDAGNVVADSLTAPLLDDLIAAYRQVKRECKPNEPVSFDACDESSYRAGNAAKFRNGDEVASVWSASLNDAADSEASARKANASSSFGNLRGQGVSQADGCRKESLGCCTAGAKAGSLRRYASDNAVAELPVDCLRIESSDVSGPEIIVASPDQAAGLRFDAVMFGGFVNGLIPCRAYCDPVGMAEQSRRREHTRDVRTMYSVASCARKRLLFTGFATCSLQAAETMDVHIESIKLRKGLRTVTTQPSELANLLH